MKNLLITFVVLLISFTMMSQTINNNSIYNVENYITDCLKELNVQGDSITITLVQYNKIKPCTVANPSLKNNYIVFIGIANGYMDYVTILSHELVHIKQLHFNEFKYNASSTYNEKYAGNYQYDIKFENEANRVGAELICKCLKIRL